LKSARDRMDIISACREAGTYRGAAATSGTTPKTVRRVIARHEASGGAPARAPRERNYDAVAGLVAERVARTVGRISAKRLLPAARAAGYAVAPEFPPPGRGAEAALAPGPSSRPPSGGVVAG
jgi:hypothetical protein